MSQFTLKVVNVGGGECRGGECRGGECRTIQIYALLSVKFSGIKICECKKTDKYQV